MPCQIFDEKKQLDDERILFERRPVYVPRKTERSSVQFQFNLNPAEIGDSLFMIVSHRMNQVVYRGAYRSSITVEIDDRLSADKYYDGLEFWLLQLERKQRCIWINERGEQYWRPGAQISIDFLDQPVLDENGLPRRFDVKIR